MVGMSQLPILVLGATGKTGRRVVDRLAARGVPTRPGSRSAEPPFDWNDRSTWAPVLDGVGAVYISYHPDLAIPGAAETVGAFAQLAAGRRLVLLTGRGEEEANDRWGQVRLATHFTSVTGRAEPARRRFAHDEPELAISAAVAGRDSTRRRPWRA